jgi:hypothetical protein
MSVQTQNKEMTRMKRKVFNKSMKTRGVQAVRRRIVDGAKIIPTQQN